MGQTSHDQTKTAYRLLAKGIALIKFFMLNLITETPCQPESASSPFPAFGAVEETPILARESTSSTTPTWELQGIPEDVECNHAYREGLRMFYPIQHILMC